MAEKLTAGMRRILQSDINRNHEIQCEVIRLAKRLRKKASGESLCRRLKATGRVVFYGKPKILQDWNSYCRIVAYYGEDLIRDVAEVRCRKQIVDVHDQVFALAQEASLPIGQEVIQWLRSKLQENADRPVEKRKPLLHFIKEANKRQSPRKPVSKPGKSKSTVSTFMTAKASVVVRASHNEPEAVITRQFETATTYIRDANRPDLRDLVSRLSLEDLDRMATLQQGVEDSNRIFLTVVQEERARRLNGAS